MPPKAKALDANALISEETSHEQIKQHTNSPKQQEEQPLASSNAHSAFLDASVRAARALLRSIVLLDGEGGGESSANLGTATNYTDAGLEDDDNDVESRDRDRSLLEAERAAEDRSLLHMSRLMECTTASELELRRRLANLRAAVNPSASNGHGREGRNGPSSSDVAGGNTKKRSVPSHTGTDAADYAHISLLFGPPALGENISKFMSTSGATNVEGDDDSSPPRVSSPIPHMPTPLEVLANFETALPRLPTATNGAATNGIISGSPSASPKSPTHKKSGDAAAAAAAKRRAAATVRAMFGDDRRALSDSDEAEGGNSADPTSASSKSPRTVVGGGDDVRRKSLKRVTSKKEMIKKGKNSNKGSDDQASKPNEPLTYEEFLRSGDLPALLATAYAAAPSAALKGLSGSPSTTTTATTAPSTSASSALSGRLGALLLVFAHRTMALFDFGLAAEADALRMKQMRTRHRGGCAGGVNSDSTELPSVLAAGGGTSGVYSPAPPPSSPTTVGGRRGTVVVAKGSGKVATAATKAVPAGSSTEQKATTPLSSSPALKTASGPEAVFFSALPAPPIPTCTSDAETASQGTANNHANVNVNRLSVDSGGGAAVGVGSVPADAVGAPASASYLGFAATFTDEWEAQVAAACPELRRPLGALGGLFSFLFFRVVAAHHRSLVDRSAAVAAQRLHGAMLQGREGQKAARAERDALRSEVIALRRRHQQQELLQLQHSADADATAEGVPRNKSADKDGNVSSDTVSTADRTDAGGHNDGKEEDTSAAWVKGYADDNAAADGLSLQKGSTASVANAGHNLRSAEEGTSAVNAQPLVSDTISAPIRTKQKDTDEGEVQSSSSSSSSYSSGAATVIATQHEAILRLQQRIAELECAAAATTAPSSVGKVADMKMKGDAPSSEATALSADPPLLTKDEKSTQTDAFTDTALLSPPSLGAAVWEDGQHNNGHPLHASIGVGSIIGGGGGIGLGMGTSPIAAASGSSRSLLVVAASGPHLPPAMDSNATVVHAVDDGSGYIIIHREGGGGGGGGGGAYSASSSLRRIVGSPFGSDGGASSYHQQHSAASSVHNVAVGAGSSPLEAAHVHVSLGNAARDNERGGGTTTEQQTAADPASAAQKSAVTLSNPTLVHILSDQQRRYAESVAAVVASGSVNGTVASDSAAVGSTSAVQNNGGGEGNVATIVRTHSDSASFRSAGSALPPQRLLTPRTSRDGIAQGVVASLLSGAGVELLVRGDVAPPPLPLPPVERESGPVEVSKATREEGEEMSAANTVANPATASNAPPPRGPRPPQPPPLLTGASENASSSVASPTAALRHNSASPRARLSLASRERSRAGSSPAGHRHAEEAFAQLMGGGAERGEIYEQSTGEEGGQRKITTGGGLPLSGGASVTSTPVVEGRGSLSSALVPPPLPPATAEGPSTTNGGGVERESLPPLPSPTRHRLPPAPLTPRDEASAPLAVSHPHPPPQQQQQQLPRVALPPPQQQQLVTLIIRPRGVLASPQQGAMYGGVGGGLRSAELGGASSTTNSPRIAHALSASSAFAVRSAGGAATSSPSESLPRLHVSGSGSGRGASYGGRFGNTCPTSTERLPQLHTTSARAPPCRGMSHARSPRGVRGGGGANSDAQRTLLVSSARLPAIASSPPNSQQARTSSGEASAQSVSPRRPAVPSSSNGVITAAIATRTTSDDAACRAFWEREDAERRERQRQEMIAAERRLLQLTLERHANNKRHHGEVGRGSDVQHSEEQLSSSEERRRIAEAEAAAEVRKLRAKVRDALRAINEGHLVVGQAHSGGATSIGGAAATERQQQRAREEKTRTIEAVVALGRLYGGGSLESERHLRAMEALRAPALNSDGGAEKASASEEEEVAEGTPSNPTAIGSSTTAPQAVGEVPPTDSSQSANAPMKAPFHSVEDTTEVPAFADAPLDVGRIAKGDKRAVGAYLAFLEAAVAAAVSAPPSPTTHYGTAAH